MWDASSTRARTVATSGTSRSSWGLGTTGLPEEDVFDMFSDASPLIDMASDSYIPPHYIAGTPRR